MLKIREIEEYDKALKILDDNIESLEEKLEYYSTRQNNMNKELIQSNNGEVKNLTFDGVNSVAKSRACLTSFFNILLQLKVERIELEEKVIDQEQILKT